jgi:hypothetical protein
MKVKSLSSSFSTVLSPPCPGSRAKKGEEEKRRRGDEETRRRINHGSVNQEGQCLFSQYKERSYKPFNTFYICDHLTESIDDDLSEHGD